MLDLSEILEKKSKKDKEYNDLLESIKTAIYKELKPLENYLSSDDFSNFLVDAFNAELDKSTYTGEIFITLDIYIKDEEEYNKYTITIVSYSLHTSYGPGLYQHTIQIPMNDIGKLRKNQYELIMDQVKRIFGEYMLKVKCLKINEDTEDDKHGMVYIAPYVNETENLLNKLFNMNL